MDTRTTSRRCAWQPGTQSPPHTEHTCVQFLRRATGPARLHLTAAIKLLCLRHMDMQLPLTSDTPRRDALQHVTADNLEVSTESATLPPGFVRCDPWSDWLCFRHPDLANGGMSSHQASGFA